MIRDLYVAGAAIDSHHRGHLQTHTGPATNWEQEWRDSAEAAGITEKLDKTRLLNWLKERSRAWAEDEARDDAWGATGTGADDK